MSGHLHLDISLALGDHNLTAKADVPLNGITALEGPSGSGKTSLLRSISGLEKAANGLIMFGDTVWQSGREFMPAQKRRIGFVFQDTRLFNHLDVAANLAYGHDRCGAGAEVLERVIDALDLGPLLGRYADGLSGGEKQRVALGRALAMDPQLLLLDEPLTGLDQSRKDEILPYISKAVRSMDCPVIYISHDAREAAFLADHILRMQDGVLTGPTVCETTLRSVAQGGVLFVDGHQTQLAVTGQVGAKYDIRINTSSVVLSRENPGPSNALISVPVEVREISDATDLLLAGNDWQIWLSQPNSQTKAMGLQTGQKIWLNVTDAQVIQPI